MSDIVEQLRYEANRGVEQKGRECCYAPDWTCCGIHTLNEAASHITSLRARVAELEGGLTKCAARLERCAIHSGTAPEYAAIAVEEYRNLVKEVMPNQAVSGHSDGSSTEHDKTQPRPAQSPAGAELAAKILRSLKWHYGAEASTEEMDRGAEQLIADLIAHDAAAPR